MKLKHNMKYKKIISISILILLLCYTIGTPIGALRVTLVSRGFIQTAILPKDELKKAEYRNEEEDHKMYQKILYILDDAPYDAEENECCYWTVTRIGIFYYGWKGDRTQTY